MDYSREHIDSPDSRCHGVGTSVGGHHVAYIARSTAYRSREVQCNLGTKKRWVNYRTERGKKGGVHYYCRQNNQQENPFQRGDRLCQMLYMDKTMSLSLV